MQLGMVGLGRMGSNLVRRLLPAGHECVVFDVNPSPVEELEADGAIGASSLDELVEKLDSPRAVWMMVPAGQIAEQTVRDLAERLEPDDVIRLSNSVWLCLKPTVFTLEMLLEIVESAAELATSPATPDCSALLRLMAFSPSLELE